MDEPERELMDEPEREPTDELQREPMDEPEGESMDEPEREPVGEPQREPMDEPEREPMDEPEREPMGEPQREPMDEPEREPMVRKIPESDEPELYQDYTIHALHAPRENDKATHLYQLLRINEPPLDTRCKQLDLLCFPDLFPNGRGGQHDSREVSLGPADYIKALLQSRDPRFRRNAQFLFFHLHQATLRQISSGVYHKLKIVHATEKMTAAKYLQMLENEELEGNLCSVFARLRNSQQYWIRPRSELNTMSFYYGPATWYLTLSPSEWTWEDLGQYLRKVNPDLADKSISELVAADPVSTSRYIDNTLKAFLEFILSDDNPIGKVIHYYYRREYQSRGLQHFHFQIWIENAPVIGVNSTEQIIKFISKYCTCNIPNKKLSPILYNRVMDYQTHRCNSYCMRSKKTKLGVRKICRFGFPRPAKDTFTLRTVVEAIAGRKALRANSRLYDLPRQQNERMINDYNAAILLAWQGNMDIQYIGEKSAILNWYITKYTTKAERSHATTAFSDITSTKSLASKLWNIALRSLSNRECGALEAADTLLGIPLYGTDPATVFRWVDVNIIRSRRVKENHVIQQLPSDSEDILYPSLTDTYYPNRPVDLESTSLYTFLSWYDVVSVQPGEITTYYPLLGRYLKKRQKPYLLNFFKYSPEQEPEKYFYSMLLLFKPWRASDSLMGDKTTYTESFNSCKDELIEFTKYQEQLSQLLEADTKVRELIGERRAEMEAEEETDSEDQPAAGPLNYACTEVVHEAMEEFNQISKRSSMSDVNAMISKLNADQMKVFTRVSCAITAQINGVTDDSAAIVRLFVSGCGGTGKSFLIQTIREWVLSATDMGVAVLGPTGISAVNISGLTIHRMLMLPVEHGKTPNFNFLSDDALKIARDVMRNVALVIIDEISMVSNVTLLYIHHRLTEIFQTQDSEDGWFGKRNMLVLGDLLQLPPVFEGPVYTPLTKDLAQKYTGSVGTYDLWRNLFSYLELTINMRQKDDNRFIELLSRVRLGCITSEDIKLLNERKMQLIGESIPQRMKEVARTLAELPPDTVCLLPTRNMCDQLNKEMLFNLSGDEIRCIASDTVDCPVNLRSKVTKMLAKHNDDSTNTAGLEKELILKIGCKVMLRRNIDVTLGLVNGAIGTVKSVKFSIDQPNVVESIIIHFNDDKVHQLMRVRSKFQILDKAYVIRQQFPITIAYSITIHKSQGLTLRDVVVDIGNSVFTCGQAYVALSRVTSLSGLHLINFDPRSIKALNSAVAEYTYLRKRFTPMLPSLSIKKQKLLCIPDRQWCVTKSTLLAQRNSAVQTCNVLTTLPNKGFLTNDCNGYASSTLQCLLSSKMIRNVLVKESSENVKHLVTVYESPNHTPMDSSSIRTELDSIADEDDPAEFLLKFIQQYSSLKPMVQHFVRTETICKRCANNVTIDENEIIFTIMAHNMIKNIKMNDLLLTAQNWYDSSCSKCDAPCKVRRQILSANSFLVLKFEAWDPTGKVRRKTNINGVPTSSINIGSSSYKAKMSVHYKETKTPGYMYVSIVSADGKWLHCHDQTLSFMSWPKGARDMYLLFLECTSVHSHAEITSKVCNSKLASMIPPKSAHTIKCKLADLFGNSPVKKRKCDITTKECVITGFDMPVVRTQWPEYRYYPVNEEWQHNACRQLGLRFVTPFICVSGGPDVILTRPNTTSLKKIGGDGNCLFRSLCYIITGSQTQHFELRSAIVAHMLSIHNLLCGLGSDGHRNYFYGNYDSVETYLATSNMANNGTWGTDTEMCVLAHLLNVVVYNFNSSGYWLACSPHGIDRSIPYNVRCRSLYIYNHHDTHFDVVTDICR